LHDSSCLLSFSCLQAAQQKIFPNIKILSKVATVIPGSVVSTFLSTLMVTIMCDLPVNKQSLSSSNIIKKPAREKVL